MMRNRLQAVIVAMGLLASAVGSALAQGAAPPPAERASLEDLLSSIVRIKTYINPDGRTVDNLGRQREGTGIIIDESGLILTIGYLMVEAHAAEATLGNGRTVAAVVVGYDHESGFGLLRTLEPVKVRPMQFGKSDSVKERDPVLVASHGGRSMVAPVRVVSKREFAGGWEYLLDEAIFTSPPHPEWSGAALINREGRLVGVGSLIVRDAAGGKEAVPGNMFVPIDRLVPVLPDLLTEGRPSSPPKPWLGMTTEEVSGKLLVSNVSVGGPAEKAGLQRGDVIAGVGGASAKSLPELYRQIWARGSAGAVVPLDVMQNDKVRRIDIPSMNRLDHLKLKSTF
jgi:S1-C subfamily serine protease